MLDSLVTGKEADYAHKSSEGVLLPQPPWQMTAKLHVVAVAMLLLLRVPCHRQTKVTGCDRSGLRVLLLEGDGVSLQHGQLLLADACCFLNQVHMQHIQEVNGISQSSAFQSALQGNHGTIALTVNTDVCCLGKHRQSSP